MAAIESSASPSGRRLRPNETVEASVAERGAEEGSVVALTGGMGASNEGSISPRISTLRELEDGRKKEREGGGEQ